MKGRAFLTAAAAVSLTMALAVLTAAVVAQPARDLPRVALVDRQGEELENGRWEVLIERLRDLGYLDGETATIYQWSIAGPTPGEVRKKVESVVASRPDVIIASGTFQILAVSEVSSTIPIVGLGRFPDGINLAKPGGNLTGLSVTVGNALYTKRLQLLTDVAPSIAQVAVLIQRRRWENDMGPSLRAAAEQLGVELVPFMLELPIKDDAVQSAIASINVSGVDAVYVTSFQLTPDAASNIRLPSLGGVRGVRDGLLMAYSYSDRLMFSRAAEYAARILGGANPGELPIEQPTTFDLMINLRTARALGIEIPPKLMIMATELIE